MTNLIFRIEYTQNKKTNQIYKKNKYNILYLKQNLSILKKQYLLYKRNIWLQV